MLPLLMSHTHTNTHSRACVDGLPSAGLTNWLCSAEGGV